MFKSLLPQALGVTTLATCRAGMGGNRLMLSKFLQAQFSNEFITPSATLYPSSLFATASSNLMFSAEAVAHIHSQRVPYCGMRPTNLVLDKDLHLKLPVPEKTFIRRWRSPSRR